jgi:hypothetical protein
VLAPGGRIAFAGEPSRLGDRLAAIPKRSAVLLAPVWRALTRAERARVDGGVTGELQHELEPFVDMHVFDPADLVELASGAGFLEVTVRGEELLANWFGWFNRALEATADPDAVPMLWRRYAFNGYLALQRLDRLVLEPRLPAAIFYNLLLTARKPGRPQNGRVTDPAAAPKLRL